MGLKVKFKPFPFFLQQFYPETLSPKPQVSRSMHSAQRIPQLLKITCLFDLDDLEALRGR